MCFSPTASFLAASTSGAIGALCLTKVRSRSEVALASIPLLFGAQQLVEGFLWRSFLEPEFASWRVPATLVYSLFSHVLWPFYAPLAVFLLEKTPAGRRHVAGLLGLGLFVSAYLLYFVIAWPVGATVVNHSIRYTYHHNFPVLTQILYLSAVCISFLVASDKTLRRFGLGLAISFVVAFSVYRLTYLSVWCFFAAVLSLALYQHFRVRTAMAYPT
jgi:hypothetical protein